MGVAGEGVAVVGVAGEGVAGGVARALVAQEPCFHISAMGP